MKVRTVQRWLRLWLLVAIAALALARCNKEEGAGGSLGAVKAESTGPNQATADKAATERAAADKAVAEKAAAEMVATEKAAAEMVATEKAAAEMAAAKKAAADKAVAEKAAADKAVAEKAVAEQEALNTRYWPEIKKKMKEPTARCKREAGKIKSTIKGMRKAIERGDMRSLQRLDKKLGDLAFPSAAAESAGQKVLDKYRTLGVDVQKFDKEFQAACDSEVPFENE